MQERLTVRDYLAGPEELTPSALVWGTVVREPSPRYGHQSVVGRAFVVLDTHVRQLDLGVVCVSPLDVVLDAERGLVVQPDVLFVAKARTDILRHQVWGAPDLVVEVASRRTVVLDRTTKLGWYRRYGVRECWLVDPDRRSIIIADLIRKDRPSFRFFSGTDHVSSTVLPKFAAPAANFFI